MSSAGRASAEKDLTEVLLFINCIWFNLSSFGLIFIYKILTPAFKGQQICQLCKCFYLKLRYAFLTILMGSPTINKGITVAAAGLLEEIEGLRFKGKKAAAFGTYGWSGESIGKISAALEKSGFEMLGNGLKCLWNPDPESIEACRAFGRKIASG